MYRTENGDNHIQAQVIIDSVCCKKKLRGQDEGNYAKKKKKINA